MKLRCSNKTCPTNISSAPLRSDVNLPLCINESGWLAEGGHRQVRDTIKAMLADKREILCNECDSQIEIFEEEKNAEVERIKELGREIRNISGTGMTPQHVMEQIEDHASPADLIRLILWHQLTAQAAWHE